MRTAACIAGLFACASAAFAQNAAPPSARPDPAQVPICIDGGRATIDAFGLRLSGNAVPSLSDRMVMSNAGPVALYAIVSVGEHDFLLPLHYMPKPAPKGDEAR